MKMSKEKDKAIMGATNKKFQQMLTDLVGYCLTDLGKNTLGTSGEDRETTLETSGIDGELQSKRVEKMGNNW